MACTNSLIIFDCRKNYPYYKINKVLLRRQGKLFVSG
jgi:hypothetical protein